MKKRFMILFLLALPAFGQTNIRWDWQANTVTGTGQMLPILALPGAFINFYTGCTALPCTTTAVTYTAATGGTTCPINAQVTWQPPVLTGCHATADSEGNFGGWFAAGAYQYVITVSGHQTGPYNFQVGGGGGSGGIAIVSCTDPDPIFGCSIANPTVSPAFSFPLKTQAANTLFGNFKDIPGAPFFAGFTCTGLLTCTYNSGTNIWNVDIPSVSTLSITTTDPVKVNGTNGPVSSGTANISVTIPPSQFSTLVTPPVAGQYVVLHPTGHSFLDNNPRTSTTADNTSGQISAIFSGGSFPPAGANIHWIFTGALAAQAPWVVAGNVNAVYAYAVQGGANGIGLMTASCSGNTINPALPIQQTTSGLTALTGATIDTAACDMTYSNSSSAAIIDIYTISDVGLIVYYTGTAPPADTSIKIVPPLIYNPSLGPELYLDPHFPLSFYGNKYAQLPAASGNINIARFVTDCNSSTTCTAGGGSNKVWMVSNGTTWTIMSGGGGGGSGTYFTETLTCASTCTLAHTPATFDNLSVNGLVMINGTDFTQSSTTVTLTTPAVGGDVYYAQYHY